MISIASIYLHNLAKRAITNGHVHPAEIRNAPKILDQVYGNGDGHLDMSDVTEIAKNVGEEIVDKASDIWDFVTSIF